MLDWKDEMQNEKSDISHHTIHKYFNNIFNSTKSSGNTLIADIKKEINEYNISSNPSDLQIEMSDLEYALKKRGLATMEYPQKFYV